MDIYINLVLTKYYNKEIKQADAMDFSFKYGKKIENYLIKAEFTNYEKKGVTIIRDLHQQKANRLKEKVSFLKPVFQAYADRWQQRLDAPAPEVKSRGDGNISSNLAVAFFTSKVVLSLVNPWLSQTRPQDNTRYAFPSSSEEENNKLIPKPNPEPPSRSVNNDAPTCCLM